MHNRITRRLILYFALVLLLFALLCGALFSLLFSSHTAAINEQDLCAHAASIAHTFSSYIASYSEGSCQGGGFRAYFRFVGDIAMSDLWLLEESGEPAVLGSLKQNPETLPEGSMELVAQVFSSGEAQTRRPESLLAINNLIVAAPVFGENGQVLFALVLHSPVGGMGHAMRDGLFILIGCLLLTLVIAFAFSVLLSSRFVTPLHRMTDVATEITLGHYRVRTGVRQNDEIGTLASHIDTLASRLCEAEQRRAELESMRQTFFSNISHELRMPVSVLKGSLEVLRDGLITDPARLQTYYDQLCQDATHMQRLINDLLEFTRLKSMHFKIERELINVVDVLRETLRFMLQVASAKGVHIRFDCRLEAFPVLGDYGRLRQLTTILLDNAIKFAPMGSQVELTAHPVPGGCEISVSDHGPGILPEELPHVFERYFHRSDALNHTGTGLGLPIAREIALRHGAQLRAESEPGVLTRFSFVLAEHSLD